MAQDYGWAYVKGSFLTGAAGTVGSLQFNGGNSELNGTNQLVYDYANTALILSGNLEVSGSVSANQFNLDVTNKTVTNLSATGSTKFGDSSDDTHEVTGSIRLAGFMSSSAAVSASIFYGSAAGLTDFPSGAITAAVETYTNSGNNRIITSVDSETINGEANLTFDGNLLTITGELSSSVSLSSSIGQFTHLTSSFGRFGSLTDGIVTMSGGSITGLSQLSVTGLTGSIATAAQPNITSLGNLTTLTVDSTTLVVNESTNRVGIGRAGPERALDVLDSSNPQLRLTHTASPARHVDFQSTAQGYLYLDPSGDRVGINTSSPTAELAVTGAAHISGNVGIYTKTPEEALDVHGNARITGNLYVSGTLSARVTDFQVSADTLTFGDESGDAITINASTVAVPNNLNFDSNTLFIDSSNNRIGIGTNAPDALLDLKGNGSSGNEVLRFSLDGDRDWSFAQEGSGAGTGLRLRSLAAKDFYIDSTAVIYRDHNGSNELMRIEPSNGEVGIGTSAPEAKLHVGGSTIITENLNVTGSITGSIFTNQTVTISGSTVSGVGTLTATTVTATNLGGTLSTAAQANITSVGNLTGLTVDSTTFVVNGTTNKVAIGRAAADKKLEIVDATAAQLRLTHTVSPAKYADLHANSTGDLIFQPVSENVGIGTSKPNANLAVSGTLHVSASSTPIKIQGLALASATTSSFLALDANNNLVLTSSGTVVTEQVNAAIVNYTNASDNRILTSVDSDSVNAEANLTFDGTTVALTGQLSASIGLSSSLGQFFQLTGSRGKFTTLTDGTISITGGQLSNASLLSTADISTTNITSSHALFTNIKGTLETAAQPNITSVGNLTSLTADSTTLVVKSTTSRVGIGRSAPQRKLDVYDAGGTPQVRVSYDSDNYSELQTSPTGDFSLSASSGLVYVSGSLTAAGGITGTLSTAAQANITSLGTLSSLTVSGDLTVDTNTLYVDSSNNKVGIGTTSPSSQPNEKNDLVIGNHTGNRGMTIASTNTGIGTIRFAPNTSVNDIEGWVDYSGNTKKMRFGTNGLNTRMTIDGDGNIGIGTGNPSAKLEVTGDLRVTAGALVTGSLSASVGLSGSSLQAGTLTLGGSVVDNDIATLSLPASTTISTYGKSLIDDSDAAAARTTLGLVIGTNVQAYDAQLDSLSSWTAAQVTTLGNLGTVTTGADKMVYTTGADTFAEASLTAAGRALLDDADAAAQRTTLGLGTIATQDADGVNIDGGAIDGVTIGTNSVATEIRATHLTASSMLVNNNLLVSGDLQVQGNIDSVSVTETTLEVSDYLIIAGNSGSAANLNGGGLQIGGTKNASDSVAEILWDNGNSALDFNIGTTTQVRLQDGVFRPESDNDVDLGTSTVEWKQFYVQNISSSIGVSGSGLQGGTLTLNGNIVDNDIATLSLPASTTISSFGASLVDDADASTARTTLGLAIGSDVQAHDADLDTLSGMQSGAASALALLTSGEVGFLDGATANSVVNSKAVIYGSSGELAGTLSTAAQTNVTSLGTLSSLAITGDLTVDTSTLKVDSSNNRLGVGTDNPDYTLDVAGNVGLDEYIYHNADADTYIRFEDDTLSFAAGGRTFVKLEESGQDKVVINNGLVNIDLKVGGANHANLIRTVASTDRVGIKTTTPETDLHVSGGVIVTDNLAVTGSITGSIFTNETITISGSTISGVGTITATTLVGTLSTAAQTNITSVGTIGAGTWQGTAVADAYVANDLTISGGSVDNSVIGGSTAAAGTFTTLDCNDGAFAIANLDIDGGTDIGEALVDADLLVVDNGAGGTNRKTAMSRVKTYVSDLTLTTAAQTNVTSLGTLTALTVDNVTIDGATIGHTSDTDLITLADGEATVAGTLTATTLAGTLSTAAQTNVTSLGTLSALAISGDLTVDTSTLKVDSSNNLVGIGTATPNSYPADKNTLVVGDQSSHNGITIGAGATHMGTLKFCYSTSANDGEGWIDYSNNTKKMRFGTDGLNTRMTIDSDGNVGIGTGSPDAKLEVTGAFYLSASSNPFKIQGLQSGTATTGSYLALDSNYNIVLTSSSGGGGGGGSVSIANDADNRIVTAVGDGTINGEANLTFDGSRLLANSGLIHKRTAVATNYTVLINDYYIGVAPTASLTIQLPNASTLTSGQTYIIKDEGGTALSNRITVQAVAGQSIDGELSVELESPYAAINLYTNGSDKYFIF